jgi:hypothetical protein
VPNLLAAATLMIAGAKRLEIIQARRLRWVRLDMTSYKPDALTSRLRVAADLVPTNGDRKCISPSEFDDFYATGTLRALEKTYQQLKGGLDGARRVD